MAEWTENGRMIPDDTPVEVPLNLRQGETESMRIARAVSLEFSQQADRKGFETIQEGMDFEVEDDEDIFPTSKFELTEMQEEYLQSPYEEPIMSEKTDEENALELEEKVNGSKETENTEKNERAPTENANQQVAS